MLLFIAFTIMFELITTVGKKSDAQQISTELVKRKLAACVSYWPISSTYRWKGKMRVEKEWRIEIKTSKSVVKKAERYLRAMHNYELPVVSKYEIKVDKNAERWIEKCTK